MKRLFVSENNSIKDTLKKLDKTAEKTLFVVDTNNVLLGTITDGDIRRHIIRTGSLEGTIRNLYNKNPIKIYNSEKWDKEYIKQLFLKNRIEVIPIINNKGQVIDYLTWTQFFSEKGNLSLFKEQLNVPVVIMAGGKGTRLAPVTDVIPKPLVPVGKKTMIEHIIDEFRKYGIKKFYITLNYKGKLIEAYFNSIEKDYDVKFIWEKEFLGTAGSLKFLDGEISENFIVSNCDIIVRANFYELFNFHLKKNSFLTSVTAIQHFRIPYGVVNTGKNGIIREIKEKPEITFQVNTGVYILNKKVLEYIPPRMYFDMPDLIGILLEKAKPIYAYPINEGDYIDLGQWEEYKKSMKRLKEVFEDV